MRTLHYHDMHASIRVRAQYRPVYFEIRKVSLHKGFLCKYSKLLVGFFKLPLPKPKAGILVPLPPTMVERIGNVHLVIPLARSYGGHHRKHDHLQAGPEN